MAIHNTDIEKTLNEVADLLEIEDANPFRVRAYRNAARVVASLSEDIADLVAAGRDLTELPSVGKDLAAKIETIVKTGSLPYLDEIAARTPRSLEALLAVTNLGPKRVGILYKTLGITDAAGLKAAAEAGKIKDLPGFGAKTEANILAALGRKVETAGRVKLAEAERFAEPLKEQLAMVPGVDKVVIAGSYRRRLETVGDIDILATCADSAAVMDAFTGFDDVGTVLSKGETRSTVILRSGLQVDLRVVHQASYGAALHYFTGSKAHNIAVRMLGLSRGYKINEYGVFKGEDRLGGATEAEVYGFVSLPYIEPELREDRGELEAAREGKLPRLLTLGDLRGDLHVHSRATDGRDTPEELAAAARERGYEYLAITDHSQRVAIAKGLNEARLLEQLEAVDAVNAGLKGVTLLKGIEVDILEDGSLDLPDSVLSRLDIRIGAVHSLFNLSREKQTERILKAMDNPLCNILAHPTGRLIGQREPYEVDMDRIMEGAKERGCFLEINAQPDRLDLSDVHIRRAKEIGLRLAIATDAHWAGQLPLIRFGVDQARRGWLEASDVINTLPLKALRKLLRR